MTERISGFGTTVRILASNTFPTGLPITQFADDTDPLDVPELEISAFAMGVNGDMVAWTVANPIPMNLAVITNADDDRNLQLLFEANRAGRNKTSAKDTITAVVTYPDGSFTTLTGGTCVAFIPSKAVSSEGRFKTNVYKFAFENRIAA